MPADYKINKILIKTKNSIGRVVPFNLNDNNVFIFDFTASNEELNNLEIVNTKKFSQYISKKLKQNKALVGIGKYNEDRIIYSRSLLFNAVNEKRTIHLGIDIWAKAGTPIFAPLGGTVHSFKNNAAFGDYGPTIILQHEIEGVKFYTLYGHLSLNSISNLMKEQILNKGDKIAEIGSYPTNGGWPPHLHFQIINDMQGMEGDFPGVASMLERKKFLELCPDANLILKIDKLKNYEN